MRDRLFAIIKPETPASFDEKLDRLHLACCEMQNEYDDLLFPVEGDAEYADEEDEPFRWSAMFWSEACLKALTERLMSLEINKDDWRRTACRRTRAYPRAARAPRGFPCRLCRPAV